jgi:hypothetical protein
MFFTQSASPTNSSPLPHPPHSNHCHPACPVYPEERRDRSRRERSDRPKVPALSESFRPCRKVSASPALAASSVHFPPVTSHQSRVPNPFTIRTSAKRACNPSRMRSSKTQHLKSFRIRIYEKKGGGAHPSSLFSGTANPGCPLRGFASTSHGSPVANPAHLFRTPNEVN